MIRNEPCQGEAGRLAASQTCSRTHFESLSIQHSRDRSQDSLPGARTRLVPTKTSQVPDSSRNRALNNLRTPVRNGNPVLSLKEERRLQKNATDNVVFPGVECDPPIASYPRLHFFNCLRPVFLFERSPCKTDRQQAVMAEQSSPYNEIIGTV